jgi:protein-disulfide isomerase
MSRRAIVLIIGALAVAAFGAAGYFYHQGDVNRRVAAAVPDHDVLVRSHSPVIGRADAPVTIVEFFDPLCETCRAYYPIVKQILAKHPEKVRLVLRYAPLHEGSDEAVKILETARMQNVFEPVLEALFATQPTWAIKGAPNLNKAWEAARAAGLDVERARRDASKPEPDEVLRKDVADLKTIKVSRTPTFFVNDKPLPSFGQNELVAFVEAEVQASSVADR